MSIQDEHELRARLSVLFDGVEPRPAPVTRVVRRGRGIRMRRWISVAAGLAIIAAGAALIPGLLQAHRVAPMTKLHYKVTVTTLGPNAKHGVVAAGVTNGRQWQVQLSGPPAGPTVAPAGLPSSISPGGQTSPPPVGWPAALVSESASPGSRSDVMIYGTVSNRVTRLELSLPGGELVSLTPVHWGGHRWVGIVIPPGVRVVRAVAYGGSTELAYSVPFATVNLDVWWRPGQVLPRRVTKLIGAGRTNGITWRYVAEIGPWGYCYTSYNGSSCFAVRPQLVPAGQAISPMTCGTLTGSLSTGPLSGLVGAASDVRKVVLRYSDGSTARFPAAEADGSWLVGYAIPAHLSVVSSAEYGIAGQVVGRASGETWNCG